MTDTNIMVFCLLLIGSICSISAEIPTYILICHRNDPELEKCITNSVESLRSHLKTGIPELEIPSVEPLELGELVVSEKTQGGLSIIVKDIKAWGPSQFKIRKLEVSKYGEEYKFEVFLPKLKTEGTYTVDGRVILLPLKGTGPFIGNFFNITANVVVTFENVEPHEHVVIKKIDLKTKNIKGNLYLSNLFNGDKALGDAVNDVVNQNFDSLSKDIAPLFEKALARVFKKISNKMGQRYTFEELFPA